ncbi:hypothetical protein F4780DRAFT_786282 [Xylariomycetidae sp. FL0641]|nr:hypothetical protein F4780DRAFT_786282 [Xylariomycetidae sp. FL0641]
MASKEEATLFKDATIITMDPSRRVLLRGYLLIEGTQITHVSSTPPTSLLPHTRILSLPGRIIIPGLVNTHAHLAQSLLRGLAEDLSLHSWLCDRIWPLEAAYGGDDGYAAARLTIAEMLLSGTTCFLEAMLTHGSGIANVARAVEEMGIRGCLAKLVKFVETNPALAIADARDKDLAHMSVDALVAAHGTHHGGAAGRISVWAALGTPRGAPVSSFSQVTAACRAHSPPISMTMHCAEAAGDLAIFRGQYSGRSPAQFCADAGLVVCRRPDDEGEDGPRTVLAHMVHLDAATDAAILARARPAASVAHCPTSNLKLGSGVADVPALLSAPVAVGLGTDGAPCNNGYDLLREAHLASILHKGAARDGALAAPGAHAALEMATVGGARALGLGAEVGSLEAGKQADVVVLDARRCWAAPWDAAEVPAGGMDPVGLVVGSCSGRDVEFVMVDGRMLVEAGQLACADEEEIVRAARTAVKGIRERSGVKAAAKAGWSYE